MMEILENFARLNVRAEGLWAICYRGWQRDHEQAFTSQGMAHNRYLSR